MWSTRKWFFTVLFCLLLSLSQRALATPSEFDLAHTWKQSVTQLLAQPLWKDRDAYDASFYLMTPLHYAFVAGDQQKIADFEKFFTQFAQSGELPSSELNQLQWVYFISRYLALKAEFKQNFSSIDEYLVWRISNFAHYYWNYAPIWQWGRLPFEGLKNRLHFIQNQSFRLSYYGVLRDNDFFILTIGSDLRYVLDHTHKVNLLKPEVNQSLTDITNTAVEFVLSRAHFQADGGWLFQPGFWADHPDYKYAGNLDLADRLMVKKVPGITEDSSHFSRIPLFLRSLYLASHNKEIYKSLQALGTQFRQKIVNQERICDGNSVFLNNYSDGHNGVYRYSYGTVGANTLNGYGPFNLSMTMAVSWYPFLPNVHAVYQRYWDSLPLSECVQQVYVGPDTTRARNPLFDNKSFLASDFSLLLGYVQHYVAKNYRLAE